MGYIDTGAQGCIITQASLDLVGPVLTIEKGTTIVGITVEKDR